jgi:transposase
MVLPVPLQPRPQAGQRLLYDLCQNLPPAERGRGRPPLPLADVVFCVLMKVYGGHAARRTQCDLQEAFEQRFITRVPHYNAIPNYLDNPALTPLLHDMIITTSVPLAATEEDFAVDSSGFTGSNYTPWYDQLYRGKKEHKWVKAHVITGVKTNIVSAVVIKDRDSSDAVQLRELLETTARNFKIEEVSADKAYNVVYNQLAIHEIGARAFIPFKSSHTGSHGGLWRKAFLFYQLHRQEFDEHYHQRSNVESTFWMIKSKFGSQIRSKTETAMMNEVLCKVVCHNICVLIQSIYELGIVPQFSTTQNVVPDEYLSTIGKRVRSANFFPIKKPVPYAFGSCPHATRKPRQGPFW